MRAPAFAPRAADVLAFTTFLAVPLAASPAFWDQFVSVKWYALEVLAAAWLAAEVWAGGGQPVFVRRHWMLVLPAAVLALASTLRMGLAAAVGPLVERGAVLALVLCAYWFVRRRGGDLRPLWLATALALAVSGALGLAQLAGNDRLAALSAGDRRGSTFGNANMAAQFAGLAAVLLLAASPPARRLRRGAAALLAALAACWIVGLGTRSVLLALAAGVAAAALASPLRARARPVLVLGLALAMAGVAWWTAARVLGPQGRAHKAQSLQDRLYVWADTVRLVADHPLGVGAGGFEDAYRPYQASGRGFVDELQVFRQPHNEYLRVAAEEGLALFVLAAVLVARLAWAAARGGAPAAPGRALMAGWSAFLLVEAFFQFPLALAFPSLCAAVLVGLALWHAEGAPPAAGGSWTARLAATAAAVVLLLGATRIARSERLFVSARNDLAAQQRACRLDPRNLPSCVMAAWLRGAAGDLPGARAGLADVLERAPHYPPAVKLLAQQALVAGDREAACVYMTAYEALFRGNSSLHADFMRACDEEARRHARERVPSPHYERFPLAGRDG